MEIDKRIFNVIKSCEDYKQLLNENQSGMGGQCYCLYNSDKYYRDCLVQVFFQGLFCEELVHPCGKCEKCSRVQNDGYTDVLFFGADEGQIKREQIDSLLESAITKPFELDFKFLIIRNGDGLTEQCQNMLLKLLENLPSFSIVIILASGTQKILPTIRSRSRNVILHGIGTPALISLLGSSERALRVVQCCDSNMSKALDFAEKKEFDRYYRFAEYLLYNYESLDTYAKYSALAVREKDKFDRILYIVKGVFYMALKGEITCIYSKAILSKIVELLSQIEIKLAKRHNKLMAIDEMMMGILKIKLKG